MIHDALALGLLVELPRDSASCPIFKDLLFAAHAMGLNLRFTPVGSEEYEQWVSEQGQPKHIVTLRGRRINAGHIAQVAAVVAGLSTSRSSRMTSFAAIITWYIKPIDDRTEIEEVTVSVHTTDAVPTSPHPRAVSGFADHRAGATPASVARLAADLGKGPMALNWLLGVRPLPAGSRLLILADQFEELFRYRHDAGREADAFVALLLAASEHPSVYVIITMRSDFLGDCAHHPGLPEAVNAGLYLTPRLDPDQMAEAIRLPARVFGGEVEPALVRRLLDEAGGEMDQLPLLQHALMRLWDLNEGEKRLITLGEFKRLGGLRKALNDHAEEAYREPDECKGRGNCASSRKGAAQAGRAARGDRAAGAGGGRGTHRVPGL